MSAARRHLYVTLGEEEATELDLLAGGESTARAAIVRRWLRKMAAKRAAKQITPDVDPGDCNQAVAK